MSPDVLYVAEVNGLKYYGIHDCNDKYGFLKKAEEQYLKEHQMGFIEHISLTEIGPAEQI